MGGEHVCTGRCTHTHTHTHTHTCLNLLLNPWEKYKTGPHMYILCMIKIKNI